MYYKISAGRIVYEFCVKCSHTRYGPWRYLKGFDSVDEAEQYIFKLRDKRVGRIY